MLSAALYFDVSDETADVPSGRKADGLIEQHMFSSLSPSIGHLIFFLSQLEL